MLRRFGISSATSSALAVKEIIMIVLENSINPIIPSTRLACVSHVYSPHNIVLACRGSVPGRKHTTHQKDALKWRLSPETAQPAIYLICTVRCNVMDSQDKICRKTKQTAPLPGWLVRSGRWLTHLGRFVCFGVRESASRPCCANWRAVLRESAISE